MVNKKCSVASCPGKPKDKLTYYCFPKNPRKNKEWVLACNRDDNFIPSQASRVCELHFQIDDFVPQKDPKSRRRLKDGIIPNLNLQPLPKLSTNDDSIRKYIDDNEDAFDSLQTNVTDLELQYKQMDQEITNASSKEDAFSIQPSGSLEEIKSDLNAEKGKRKKWDPPKFKVSQKDLADLPEDSEVTQSIISSNEQNYYLSFLPQTEKNDISIEPSKTADRLLSAGPSSLDEDPDLLPDPHLQIDNLTANEKIEKLSKQLNIAYKKNATLARKNKSLRLQFYAACKKTLSQKAKMEVAKDVLKPFFTPTQIDCFCRPSWLRSRNWAEEDFQIALALRKLMSKKAFGYLRKKRMVPMPSLTSLRKYNKMKGIVLQHNTMRTSSSRKSVKTTKTSTKNEVAVKGSNIIMSSATNSKIASKQTSLRLVDSSQQKQDGQIQQQPILFASSGELGNVEFLHQSVDDQTGNVITTSLPMMTTSDGTTVVQLSGNTDEVEEGLVNYANGQTVQMVMVDPNNPNQFTLQQHPMVVTSTATSSPMANLNLEEPSGQSLQQNPRSVSRIKSSDGETWKFIQIG